MISNVHLRMPRVVRLPAHQFVSAQTVLACAAGLLVVCRLASLAVQFTAALPSATLFDEDAFYVFSVAPDVAQGHGVTADGVQWTNGFQPLWTFIATLPYLIFTDDRLALGSIEVLSIAIWLASAYLFVQLVGRLIGHPLPGRTKWALGVVFLADLQLQAKFFNGLETGLYVLCILALLV